MHVRLVVSALFAVLLLLTGCRDSLVDANGQQPITPVPVAEYPDVYFKGPTELSLGTTGSFRVQALEGATEYRWFFSSSESGQLQGSIRADSQGLERQFTGTAIESGIVTISVSMFDAEERLMTTTTKRVVIFVE